MMQDGEGVRVATSGTTVSVDVGPNDDSVEVGELGSSETKSYPVEGDKSVAFPVPEAPGGTILVIRVGKGKRQRRILVTIVAPPP